MRLPEDVNMRRPVIVGKIMTHKLPNLKTVGVIAENHKPERLG
jgi:hypothetical protein